MRKVLNNKVLLFIVAILLLANIAMLFYFLWMRDPKRNPNAHGDRQKSPMTEFLQTNIGFNAEQLAAFEKTRQKHRQLLKPLFEDIKTAKVQFYSFLTNPQIS